MHTYFLLEPNLVCRRKTILYLLQVYAVIRCLKSFSSAVFSKRISSSSSCSSALSCFAASSSVAYLLPEPRQENKETTDCRCDGADLSDLGDPPPDTPVKDLARGRNCRGELEHGEIEEAMPVTQCERVVLRGS